MNKISFLAITFITGLTMSANALGCDKPDLELSNDQIKSYRATLQSDEADPLDPYAPT